MDEIDCGLDQRRRYIPLIQSAQGKSPFKIAELFKKSASFNGGDQIGINKWRRMIPLIEVVQIKTYLKVLKCGRPFTLGRWRLHVVLIKG